MSSYVQLRDIVNIDDLQEIQYKVSRMTGFASIIVDRDGQPVTPPTKFSEYCNLIRSTEEGCRRCYNSDGRAGCMASRTSKPRIYLCHGGLVDLAAPIVINNIHVGAILAGQILPKRPNKRYTDVIKKKNSYLGSNVDSLIKMLCDIQIVPEEKVESSAELLHVMASQAASIGNTYLLSQQLSEENHARTKLEAALRSLELRGLISKISPHFLLNALNIIAKQAILEDAYQTQEIVYHLSNLLRYSLGKVGKKLVVTLRDEIAHVNNYLVLQRIRYGNRVRGSIDIPADLMPIVIPPMTLQPLVENAIIHGLEPKVDGGQIIIRAWQMESNDVLIEISDNGIGMNQEKLTYIRERINLKYLYEQEIGITSVQRRLQLFFGPGYGLSLDSSPGHGTTVQILIPSLKDGAGIG